MTGIRIVFFLVFAHWAMAAGDSEEIHALLRRFNENERHPESQAFRTLFTTDADYRGCFRRLKGPDALAPLFTNRKMWSESTPPILQEESVKFVGRVALVDAHLVWHGSTIVNSEVAVVLLLQKEAGEWKISSWRMPNCVTPFTP